MERLEGGTLLLDLPVCQDRTVKVFLLLFGLLFALTGLLLVFGKGEAEGWIPMGIGLLTGWFGLYMSLGRVMIRMEAEVLEWSRRFLKPGRIHAMRRDAIARIWTEVNIRSNGYPTSWSIRLQAVSSSETPTLPILRGGAARNWIRTGTARIPGGYRDALALWLGGILGKWAQAPFDDQLDRRHKRDS